MRAAAAIYIIIPVHNRCAITRECLTALRAQSRHHLAVVVDDGSTDGTWEMLAAFPEVVRLRGAGDLWWTGATNVGCAWVLAHATDSEAAVVTLNDDTLPGPEWLEALAGAAAQRPRALVGSLTVSANDGRVSCPGHWIDWRTARFRQPWHGYLPEEVTSAAGPFLRPDALSGKGTWIPLAALRELGPFDPGLPQYGADYEYAVRAARHGWELLVSTQAILPTLVESTGLHAGRGRSPAALARSLWSRRSATGLPQRLRFAWRACPRPALLCYILCDVTRVVAGGLRELLQGRAARAATA